MRRSAWPGSRKDQVFRLCLALDERVAFRNRPLEGAYQFLWLDAKDEKVREGDSPPLTARSVTRRYLSEDSMAKLLTAETSSEGGIERELRSRKELQAA